MHEISICESIIKTIEDELEEDQFQNVRGIYVKIGVLSCVDPKVLAQVFACIIKETPFSKSSLHTEFVEILVACENCKKNFKVKDYRFVCPDCDKSSSQIVEGNELTIYKVFLEEPSYAEVNQ